MKKEAGLANAIAEKIEAGEELSAMEAFIFDEFQKVEITRMFKELKAALRIKAKSNVTNKRFSGACTDSTMAFAEMMDKPIPANAALLKLEASCPLSKRSEPLLRYREDPVFTWGREIDLNKQPSLTLTVNGNEVPPSIYEKLSTDGEWLSGNDFKTTTTRMKNKFSTDEYEAYFDFPRVDNLPVELMRDMKPGDHAFLGYSGDVFTKDSGGVQFVLRNSAGHAVFLYRISDRTFAILDHIVEAPTFLQSDTLTQIDSVLTKNAGIGEEQYFSGYRNAQGAEKELIGEMLQNMYGRFPMEGETYFKTKINSWILVVRSGS